MAAREGCDKSAKRPCSCTVSRLRKRYGEFRPRDGLIAGLAPD